MAKKIYTIQNNGRVMYKMRSIHIARSEIMYYVFGNGQKPIFCLHGFSLSGIEYLHLGEYCPKDKIMFAIDFPFHGDTIWNEREFLAEQLQEIFEKIMLQELGMISPKYMLIAHSMGGRIALYMYQCFAEKMDKLILMAPDGLKAAWGHKLLFRTKVGPKVFRKMSNSSRLILSVSQFAKKSRIINRSVFNLIKSSYEDEDTARLVYERLVMSRHFYPNIEIIKKLIVEHQTPVYIFFGKYDTIVPSKLAKNLLNTHTQPFVDIEMLLSGHLILSNIDTLKDIGKVL